MSKTIKFYNLALLHNGEKTDVDVLKVLDNIAKLAWNQKVKHIQGNFSAMFPMYLNERHKDKRIIPFGKFRRNYKPFLGNIANSNLREIQDDVDVVELVTMVYDQKHRTAILDYNREGLKEKDIVVYLNVFVQNSMGSDWEFKFFPIISSTPKEEVLKSSEFRSVEIKLKLDKFTENVVNQGIQVNSSDNVMILDVLKMFEANNTTLDATTLKFELNVGNKQNVTMNLESIRQLVNTLNLDSDYIESIKLKYRNISNGKLDTVDFKNINKQVKEIIFQNDDIKNPASEYVGNTILELYPNFESTLHRSHRNFISDMVTIDHSTTINPSESAV
ncbi:hypothetical protein RH915_05905 [Serpentinicella sp. ANB-PHB4]|uniref:DUF6731 family protein n=1 Tax=Serpentinicella sp. ANB-PHB4 TaxID=3074076 RepID=UPI002861B58F|nr:DUF6731 family protein [Serpentinicella sp. ANB-PHB4]MDR5659017.1 hypothetical protein [Serpentinicella sp. ANB-PHB4]